MRELEERIARDGTVKPGQVLKVDSFINHQMDPELFYRMAQVWKEDFADERINKVMTIEASGIGIAAVVGLVLGVPVVFAKKSKSINLDGSLYRTTVHSYTHGTDSEVIVSKKFVGPDDRILLVDDFLANGCAMDGLLSICEQAGATVCGIAIAIEKGFQPGGARLRERGIRVDSLAIVRSMDAETGRIEFGA